MGRARTQEETGSNSPLFFNRFRNSCQLRLSARSFFEKMDKGLALVPGMLGNAAGSFDRRNMELTDLGRIN